MSNDPSLGTGAMFDAIAPRYDLLNRVLSFGFDRGWRDKAARALEIPAGGRALDVATGTADLAIVIANMYPDARVDGSDPSAKMLEHGRAKVERAGLERRVTLGEAIAEKLPYESGAFDGASIAFGIRNVPDRVQGLREMARVVRPGGRVVVLELAEPEGGFTGAIARGYVHQVVPFVGGLLSGAREYKYLQKSIAAFPTKDVFAKMMEEAGMRVSRVESLTFGAATLYVGVVGEAPAGEAA